VAQNHHMGYNIVNMKIIEFTEDIPKLLQAEKERSKFDDSEKFYAKLAIETGTSIEAIKRWYEGQNIPNKSNLEELNNYFSGHLHICRTCSIIFTPTNLEDAFCSQECRNNFSKNEFTDKINIEKRRSGGNIMKVEKECEKCGKSYIGLPQQKYCSEKCRKLDEVNLDYYAVLYRDNFRCRYCGRKPADGIKLTIDHVYPKSKGEKMISLI